MHPSVSVVMPIRNEERHLRAAVDRVLDQGYPGELEILLAVGPSEDRTREIADDIAAAEPRVVVLDNPTGFTPQASTSASKPHATTSSSVSTGTANSAGTTSQRPCACSARPEPPTSAA